MSRIDATRPGGIVRSTPPGQRQAGTAFRLPEETASQAPEATVATGEVSAVSLGALLAAEALDQEAAHDRAARRQGQIVLAGLTALQRALLRGGDLGAIGEQLAALVAGMPRATDPDLAAVLDAIALRARVELARLGG